MIFEIAEGKMSWMTFLVLSPTWLKHLRNNLGAEKGWRGMLIYLSPFLSYLSLASPLFCLVKLLFASHASRMEMTLTQAIVRRVSSLIIQLRVVV